MRTNYINPDPAKSQTFEVKNSNQQKIPNLQSSRFQQTEKSSKLQRKIHWLWLVATNGGAENLIQILTQWVRPMDWAIASIDYWGWDSLARAKGCLRIIGQA